MSINKGSSTSCHASAKLDTAQQTTNQLGYLYLEYSETSIPYDRPPIFTKVEIELSTSIFFLVD